MKGFVMALPVVLTKAAELIGAAGTIIDIATWLKSGFDSGASNANDAEYARLILATSDATGTPEDELQKFISAYVHSGLGIDASIQDTLGYHQATESPWDLAAYEGMCNAIKDMTLDEALEYGGKRGLSEGIMRAAHKDPSKVKTFHQNAEESGYVVGRAAIENAIIYGKMREREDLKERYNTINSLGDMIPSAVQASILAEDRDELVAKGEEHRWVDAAYWALRQNVNPTLDERSAKEVLKEIINSKERFGRFMGATNGRLNYSEFGETYNELKAQEDAWRSVEVNPDLAPTNFAASDKASGHISANSHNNSFRPWFMRQHDIPSNVLKNHCMRTEAAQNAIITEPGLTFPGDGEQKTKAPESSLWYDMPDRTQHDTLQDESGHNDWSSRPPVRGADSGASSDVTINQEINIHATQADPKQIGDVVLAMLQDALHIKAPGMLGRTYHG